jgi:crotonobetainyl-CoA:carnitine CoA-transferase CaiB-like acyl-CoA transferase
MTSALPYKNLRVLDLSQGLAGPYCGMLLAHYGADVVKLEPPGGDWSRHLGTRYGDHTALDVACNGGKRSLVLDLKTPQGKAAAQRIAARCDVVIEGFRPGVAAKLGLGYEELSRTNAQVIYLSVSGFGQQGPYAHRPATDTVIQAFSGMMSLNRDASGKPSRTGFLVADTCTALYAFQSVSVALYAKRQSGQGAYLDVSLMQSCAAFLSFKLMQDVLEGGSPRLLNAPAGTYRTADGWIAITLSKEEHFRSLCQALSREALLDDARFATFEARADHSTELVPLMQEALLGRSTQEWIARLEQHDVLCNRVYEIADWLADPHVQATQSYNLAAVPGMGEVPIAAIPAGGVLGREAQSWPRTGEHSEEILGDYGFSAAEIAALQITPSRSESL